MRVQTCCWCANLRTGCLIIGLLQVAQSLGALLGSCLAFKNGVTGIIINIIFLILASSFIYGILKKNEFLMKLFAYVLIAQVVLIVIVIVLVIMAALLGNKNGLTPDEQKAVLVMLILFGTSTLLNFYYIIVILSYIDKLRET